ncbi:alkane 1-monooxygenase [Chitinimonas naiadis]
MSVRTPAATLGWRCLRYAGFLVALLAPLQAMTGYLAGGWRAWQLLAIAFVLAPCVDYLLGTDPTPPGQEGELLRHRWFDTVLYLYVAAYWAALLLGLWCATHADWTTWERVGCTLSMGVVGGVGIVVAHELGHRRTRYERFLAACLLQPVCYGHFTLEHNRGHHAWVATLQDPATARYGESFYRFYLRCVPATWRAAWRLEFERMGRLGISRWSWRNAMWRHVGISLLIAGVVLSVLGPAAFVFWVVQAVLAFSLLEAVNYLEHYGLLRQLQADGSWEPVADRHSWNSNHLFSNLFIYQLQRHADHHANPSRPYQALRPSLTAPQLPSGYTAMIPLALIPPLWFRIMNPRAERWRQTLDSA